MVLFANIIADTDINIYTDILQYNSSYDKTDPCHVSLVYISGVNLDEPGAKVETVR